MPQTHKTSFLITLSLIFLLPLFFIPGLPGQGGALYLESAKTALLLLGIIVAALVFAAELWREGSIAFPKHYFLAVTALLPAVYLLSALLSTPTSLSLFGYVFEVGTFGYMLLGSAALLLSSVIFADTSRGLQALVALFVSLSLIAVFASIKILAGLSGLGGDFLAMGQFFTNMGNPVGNWTDLAVVFGLLSLFSALTLGTIPMKSLVRTALYVAFILSTVLLVIINFSVAFIFTLAASVLLLLYFIKIENRYQSSPGSLEGVPKKGAVLPVILGVVSIIFLINPTISPTQGTIGNVVARVFGIENAEVRPSFSATFDISKAVLSQSSLLGSGPNTFSHDWLIFKPANINTTPFWSVAFPFGSGFIPTQIASTGILGSALWLAFFILLIILGVKALNYLPESRAERFVVVSSLLAAFFLWATAFLYAPSGTVLMLAFIFTGVLVAALAQADIIPYHVINLKESPQNRFASALLIAVLAIGAAAVGYTGFGKTVSAYHWKSAIDLSNIAGTPLEEVESKLEKAVKFAPADVYYVALSRLNFSKAQAAVNRTTGTPEENQAILEDALRKSIDAAKNAVSVNPAGYQNWATLGMIYGALVPPPLSVEGAYENALFAYNEALKRNPSNPELYLLLARLELSRDNVEQARSFIRNSIALKEDYADAYLMLAELEVGEGNTAAAIASAEKLALLVPNNPGLYFELGVLKYSSKDYKGAEESLNQALLLSPEYANARYYLGLTLSELGRFDEARLEFEELLRTNPENEIIEEALDDLRAGRKPGQK